MSASESPAPAPAPSASARIWRIGSLAVVTGFFTVFVSYYSLSCFRSTWGGDIHCYIATVHALYADFVHPGHEVMAVEQKWSVSYSPYMVLVAGVGRLLGVTPYRALQLAGVANILLYVAAIVVFFRTFATLPRSPWPPLLFLITSLLLRTGWYGWSSEVNYIELHALQAYPSLLGWSIALLAFVLADRACSRPRQFVTLVGLTLAVAFLVLTHSITASWMIGIIGVRALLQLASAALPAARAKLPPHPWRPPVGVLASLVAGLLLTLAWPYFSPLRLIGFGGAQENAPFGADFLGVSLPTYFLALAAIMLAPRLRWLTAPPGRRDSSHVTFMIAGFLATLAAWAVFRRAGISYGDRYVLFMLFFPQVLAADAVATALESLGPDPSLRGLRSIPWLGRWPELALVTLFALAVHLAPWREQSKNFDGRRMLSYAATEPAYYSKWRGLRAGIRRGDVLMMADSLEANDVAAITGARSVWAPFRYSVPDWKERESSVNLFFNPDTGDDARMRELRRWNVTKVVLTGQAMQLEAKMQALLGPPIAADRVHVVHEVSR